MKEIGVGIIGYGFIGRVHALSYQAVPWTYPGAPRPRLLAACTSSEESAQRVREEGLFPFVFSDYRELLACEGIDAVSICTPNDSHREIALAAIRAGKHVYCDKPLALTAQEAAEVASAAAQRPELICQMTFQYRFVPALRRARELVRDGFLGRVFSFRAAYLHSGYIDPKRPLSWRLQMERSGGGAVADLGAHVIDLIHYLVGGFRAVQALQRTFIKERPVPGGGTAAVTVDDITLAQVELENGAIGTLEFSRLSTGCEDELRLEIHGECGALAFNLMEPNWLYAYDVRDPEEPMGGLRGWRRIAAVGRYPEKGALPGPKFSQGWARFHVASAYDFLSNVVRGQMGEISPSFWDGLAVQNVIDALQRSASSGAWAEVQRA